MITNTYADYERPDLTTSPSSREASERSFQT
jgi:hypothetical protein